MTLSEKRSRMNDAKGSRTFIVGEYKAYYTQLPFSPAAAGTSLERRRLNWRKE